MPKREVVTITISITFAVVISIGSIIIFLVLKRESVVKFFASMEKFNHSSLTKSASEVFSKDTPNGNLNRNYMSYEDEVSLHDYNKNRAKVSFQTETNDANMKSKNQDDTKNKKKYTQDEIDRIIYAQTPVFTVEEHDSLDDDENNDVFYNNNDDDDNDKQTSF